MRACVCVCLGGWLVGCCFCFLFASCFFLFFLGGGELFEVGLGVGIFTRLFGLTKILSFSCL